MNRFSLLKLLLVLVLQVSFLQAQTWRWERLQPQGNDLAAFFSPQSSSVVFGCGKKGALIRSDDVGLTWYRYQLPLPQVGKPDLHAGFFVDGNTGYICGTYNCILKTTDGGDSWNLLTALNTSGVDWNDVCFISADTGVVVGDNGDILRTTDGGTTWLPVSSGVTTDLIRVSFNDSQTGFIDADNKLLKTIDGGLTWTTHYTFPANTSGIAFTRSDTLYAKYTQSTTTRIVSSVNGGTTWQTVFSYSAPVAGTICFINDSTGLDVRSTSVYRTNNRGVTWTPVSMTNNWIRAINAVNPFCMIGGGYTGELVVSSDLGASWSVRSTGDCNTSYYCVGMNNTGQGFALSLVDMLRTSDGGLSWSAATMPTCNGVKDLQFLGSDTILALGNCGLYRSPDAGISWTLPSIGIVNTDPKGFGFLNADTGMMVAANAVSDYQLHRTYDGGATWDTVYSNTTLQLHDVAMVSDSIAVIGSQGRILRTTDAGVTWTTTYNSGTAIFIRLQAFGDTVYAQSSARVLRSVDGGATWLTLVTGLSSYLRMDFRSAQDGMIAATAMGAYGQGGYVASTSDAGITWTIYPDDMGNTPSAFSAADTSLILLSLNNSGLVSWESDTTQLQSTFSVSQYNICLGDTIHFLNHGATPATTYTWYLDGVYQTSTYNFYWLTNIAGQHRVGLYTITASDSAYSEAIVRIDTIPSPYFNYNVNDHTVTFIDQSNSLSSWEWSFGDSAFSPLMNPIHTYGAAGVFPVQLIISNACGTDSVVRDVAVLEDFSGYTFRSVYDIELGWDRTFIRVESCYDGGILALGDAGNSYSGEMVKLDGEGNLHWRDEQEVPTAGVIKYNDIAVMPVRHYLAAGSTASGTGVITRVDSADRIVWSKHYASFGPVSIDARGAYIYSAGLSSGIFSPAVALLDSSGNLLWTKEFSSTHQVSRAEVCVLSDGTFIAVFTDIGYGTFLVVRIDLNGTVLWMRDYVTSSSINFVQDLFADSSGRLYLCGSGLPVGPSPADSTYNFICCINAFTNTDVWNRRYDLNSNYGSPRFAADMRLRQGRNGEMLAVLRTTPNIIGYNNKHYLLLLDSIGNLISASLDNGYIDALAAMPDSGYVLVGEGVNQPVGGNIYPMIKRINSDAQPTCLGQYAGCVVVPFTVPYIVPANVMSVVPLGLAPDSAARYKRATIIRETYCSCSNPLFVTVSDDTTICPGDTAMLSVSGGLTYQWWPVTSLSSGTDSVVYAFPTSTTSYDLFVTGVPGCTHNDQVTVTIDVITPPVISVAGNVLSSDYATGNQWYFNGNPIPGAIQQQYTATAPGVYTVEVTNANGCTAISSPVTISSIGNNEGGVARVYPVPATDRVEIELYETEPWVITLYDFTGRPVRQWVGESRTFTLYLGELSAAHYELIITTETKVYRQTLPVQQ